MKAYKPAGKQGSKQEVTETQKKLSAKHILDSGAGIDGRYIRDYGQLKEFISACRRMGYRIVLTQGVYDMIHEGHAEYLAKARGLGDLLIVGVDSDALTKKRKGPTRPVVPERERVRMLLHLRHVDIVTLRDIDTGIGGLIRLVRPDVLVTSETTKDFQGKLVKQYQPYCGEIVVLPSQSPTSSTARVRNLMIEGAEQLSDEVSALTKRFMEQLRAM